MKKNINVTAVAKHGVYHRVLGYYNNRYFHALVEFRAKSPGCEVVKIMQFDTKHPSRITRGRFKEMKGGAQVEAVKLENKLEKELSQLSLKDLKL